MQFILKIIIFYFCEQRATRTCLCLYLAADEKVLEGQEKTERALTVLYRPYQRIHLMDPLRHIASLFLTITLPMQRILVM